MYPARPALGRHREPLLCPGSVTPCAPLTSGLLRPGVCGSTPGTNLTRSVIQDPTTTTSAAMAPGEAAAADPAVRPSRCPGLGPWTRSPRQAPPPQRLRPLPGATGGGGGGGWPAGAFGREGCPWRTPAGKAAPSPPRPVPRPAPVAKKPPPHACAARPSAQALRRPPISRPVKTPSVPGSGGAHAARWGGSGWPGLRVVAAVAKGLCSGRRRYGGARDGEERAGAAPLPATGERCGGGRSG